MPRRARIFLPGFPHHVTQRGNRKTQVFLDDEDREWFLRLLRRYARLYQVDIGSYCLMENHFHLITRPPSKEAQSHLMHDLNGCYAWTFNQKYALNGHLWQARFFACAMDETHLWNALLYVAQNPVRGGLVVRASDYRWSSAAAHCNQREDRILSPSFPLPAIVTALAESLDTPLETEQLDRLRRCTATGIPYASEDLVKSLETWLGFSILPRKKGRKAKASGKLGTDRRKWLI